jgi:hypothetical protein
MDQKKLAKIERLIAECRRKSNKHRDLEHIVLALERRRVKRGKEPTYESVAFPNVNMITIPDHGGKNIKRGTSHSILNQCEEDVWRFKEAFNRETRKEEITQKESIQNDDSGYTN